MHRVWLARVSAGAILVAALLTLLIPATNTGSGAPPPPASVREFYHQGLARVRAGDLPGAIASYNQVLQQDPAAPRAYGDRGVARAASGDIEGGLADLRTAAVLFAARGDAAKQQRALDLAEQIQARAGTPPRVRDPKGRPGGRAAASLKARGSSERDQ